MITRAFVSAPRAQGEPSFLIGDIEHANSLEKGSFYNFGGGMSLQVLDTGPSESGGSFVSFETTQDVILLLLTMSQYRWEDHSFRHKKSA